MAGTDGWIYISEYDTAQNGQVAWLSFVGHYDGGAQNKKQVAKAEATIETVHYKNEAIFKFDAMATKLVEASLSKPA